MKLQLILIALFLVTATIPIVNVTAAEFDYTVTLIDNIEDYSIFAHPEKIVDKRIYTPQVLTEGHMPLLIQTTDKTVDFNKGQLEKLISHTVLGSNNKNGFTFSYYMLINETYKYQLGVYDTWQEPYEYTWHDNETGMNYTETRYYNKTEQIDTITIQDYRYVWKNLEDLEEYDSKNRGFIVIDIVGNTLATIEPWSADIIPTIEVNGLKKTYPEFAWWDGAWTRSKKITIDHTKVACDLYNFTWLLQNKSADFANARADGYDFRVVNRTNATELYIDLEKFNTTNWELCLWVNITYLSSTDDTILWLYYGNPGASTNPSSPKTYDDNYVLYVHFNETGAIQHDYTGNKHNSTNIFVAVQGTDYDRLADGHNNYSGDAVNHKVTFGPVSNYNEFTIEIWHNVQYFQTYQRIVSAEYEFLLDCKADGSPRFYMGTGAGWGAGITGGAGGIIGFCWQQQVGTSDGTNTGLFVDGVVQGHTANNNNLDTAVAYVGGDQWEYRGMIDIWTVSNCNRSVCWIQTRYNNIIDPGDSAFFGPEIVNITAAEMGITEISPGNNSHSACPCIDSICVTIYNSKAHNMNLSFHNVQNNVWYNLTNVPNGTWCICMCCIDICAYNFTYYWNVNISDIENPSAWNYTSNFSFKTAWEPANCSVNCSNCTGGSGSDEAWIVGVVIIFSIFGLIAFIKTRRMDIR